MIRVTLTQFTDFVQKAGSPKVTLVRRIKHQPDFDKRSDFWLSFRNGLKELLGSGRAPTRADWLRLGQTSDDKKRAHYAAAADGLWKVLKKHDVELFSVLRASGPMTSSR